MEWEEFQKRSPMLTSESFLKRSFAILGYALAAQVTFYLVIMAVAVVFLGFAALFE